jgi:hypothetical protein
MGESFLNVYLIGCTTYNSPNGITNHCRGPVVEVESMELIHIMTFKPGINKPHK